MCSPVSSVLENIDVVELTKRFREDGWASSESSYVISMDMSGNPIYDFERNVSLYKKDLLTESEKDVLKELNWPVNQIQNGIHNS